MSTVNNSDMGETKKYGAQWFPTEVSCMDHEEEESPSSSSDSSKGRDGKVIKTSSRDFEKPLVYLQFDEHIEDADIRLLAEKLKDNQGMPVEFLHIFDVRVDDKRIKPIIQALASNTTLKHIILYNSVTDKVVKWIVRAMKTNTTLKILYLLGNRISCCCLIGLLPLLDHANLKLLALGKNSFCCKGGDKLLTRAMEKNATGCGLSYEAKTFKKSVEEEGPSSSSSDSEKIPEGSMYFAHPSDEGFKLLMRRRTITEIAFRDIDGCIAYEALKQRNDLEILGLIDVVDLKPVAEGLKISTSLTQLWILYIDEGSPQGMREMGNALSENVTLKSLYIDCYYDPLDMDAFLDGITVNTTLEKLILCIEIDDKEELEKRIRAKLQGLIEIEFEDPFADA